MTLAVLVLSGLVGAIAGHVLFSLVTVLMLGVYLVGLRILTRHGASVADVRLILLTSFVAYGLAAPMFGLPVGRGLDRSFSSGDRLSAHLAYFLGELALVGAIYATRRIRVVPGTPLSVSTHSIKAAALGGMVIGFVFLIVYYAQLGGVLSALSLTRKDRSLAFSEAGWNPWVQFLLASVVLYWLALLHAPRGRQLIDRLLLGGVAATMVALWLAEGERGRIGYLLIAGLAAISTRRQVRPSRRIVAVILVVWLAFGVIQQLRQAFPAVVSRRDWSELEYQIDRTRERGWSSIVAPDEFRASYITVLDAVKTNEDVRLGETYLRTPAYVMPGSVSELLGVTRPPNISKEFGEVLEERYSVTGAISWGYSPVAEAFRNFGWVGPPLMMFLFGLAAAGLVVLRNRGGLGRVALYCVMAPLGWRLCRTGFANVVGEVVYQGAVLWVLVLGARLLDANGRGSSAVHPDRERNGSEPRA